MIRTRVEIAETAKNVVSLMVSELMEEFPTIKSAIDKLVRSKSSWGEMLDDLEEQVREILITKFGSSD